MLKYVTIGAVLLAIILGAVYLGRDALAPILLQPTPSTVEDGEPSEPLAPMVVAKDLTVPWEIAFLSDGDMLVTERPGRLLRIRETREVIEVSGVVHRGEGGLLGLALHPDFDRNNLIYLYMTTDEAGGITNRVERYHLDGTTLSDRTTIIEGIPGASNHDGGRIAFGPPTSCESGRADCYLYITTGDAGRADSAQDRASLAGKILRLHADGSIPADNPFDSAVYSYGHRNVQGIAWDERGQLWATEHGRSGAVSGFDELNKIVKGANYGWPDIEGDERAEGMRAPELHSGPAETWAPGGLVYTDGHLVFPGLRGQSLYVSDISSGEAAPLTAYLRSEYGRLRTVVFGPDGMLYILTSNRDGRGNPVAADDRIIRIDPSSLGL
jgi:glucose/arabinose dehydrogenase